MLTLPPWVRIFVAVGATGMRRGMESLSALVRERLGLEPFSGQVFLFRNRRGDRVKILMWDRQEWSYARHGVDLTVSTLADFVEQVANALEPITGEMKRQVLASSYLQTDDTPVTVLGGTGGSFKGRLWVYLDPKDPQAVSDATAGRGRDGPDALFEGFQGKLQADAYPGYDGI